MPAWFYKHILHPKSHGQITDDHDSIMFKTEQFTNLMWYRPFDIANIEDKPLTEYSLEFTFTQDYPKRLPISIQDIVMKFSE